MQVFYAKSCYAPASDMTTGMLKYTLDVAGGTGDYTLQLYTSSGVSGQISSCCPVCLRRV
jgi:hypothetical protein